MSIRSFFPSFVITLLIIGSGLLCLAVSFAQVRSSPGYRLESDSVNFGGGLSTSTNYNLESTAGEVATGRSTSSIYGLRAGYQQMQEVFLSMTAPANVELKPDLGGLTGGVATGSTGVFVLTDSPSGYQLTLAAAAAPAMRKGSDVINDYVPVAAPNPDPLFITGFSDVHFGFSPQGGDVVSRYRNNGSVCNTGGVLSTAEVCWAGLTTTPQAIAVGGANQPSGATTTLYFRIGIGGGTAVPAGTYIATTTLTALPL